MIGTLDGVVAVRAIRRKPEQDRYDVEALNALRGLPWRHKAGVQNEPRDAIEYGSIGKAAIKDAQAG